MKTLQVFFFFIAAAIITSCSGSGRKTVTAGELIDHVRYLSSDSLRGRLTGSAGDSLAAEYIRMKLASYGLKPLTGDGFQRFKITSRILAGPDNMLKINNTDCKADEDFLPFSFSGNGVAEAPVVFAGYGFNINNDTLKWNDYEKTSVKGKWVMVLRGDPDNDNPVSRFTSFNGDRNKALTAKDQGAAGILFVSGEAYDKDDKFEALVKGEFSVGIPAFRIKRSVADKILAGKKTRIADLEKKLDKTHKPSSFETGSKVTGKADVVQELANTRNVEMILPGEDEKLKDQYIVMGAHFDHLGMGGPGSSSRAVDTIGIHHGADDNASGVAMMLELAQKFAGTKGSHKRSIICLSFSGEEEGILGSKYFTDNPPIDLSKIDAMLNFDMVGRLRETKDIQIGGVGTAAGLKEFVKAQCDTNILKPSFSEEGYGPSDHASFYMKDIPVLYFTTGAHPDYHTPRDTYDKINYKGMVTFSDLIYKVEEKLANDTAKLKFSEAGPKAETSRTMRRRGITLGIMPDVTGSIKNGLRADFVTPGRPAALGGMKKGDIITSINNKPVNNIEDYMFRLNQLKKGQTISVEVLRNSQKEVLIIQL